MKILFFHIENQDYSNFTLTLVKRLAPNLPQDLNTFLWTFWHKLSESEIFFPKLTLKVTIFIFWSGLFVIKQFFVNISIANYFIKNNQDTFFVEHQILYKRSVLIIFSKISVFCPISHLTLYCHYLFFTGISFFTICLYTLIYHCFWEKIKN